MGQFSVSANTYVTLPQIQGEADFEAKIDCPGSGPSISEIGLPGSKAKLLQGAWSCSNDRNKDGISLITFGADGALEWVDDPSKITVSHRIGTYRLSKGVIDIVINRIPELSKMGHSPNVSIGEGAEIQSVDSKSLKFSQWENSDKNDRIVYTCSRKADQHASQSGVAAKPESQPSNESNSTTTKQVVKKSLVQLQKEADSGDAHSQLDLGILYAEGDGAPKNYTKAMEWYQKAAAQGNSYAQGDIGNMYLDGYGVPKDYAKAMEWYQKAAAQGNSSAQGNIGFMYREGYGVPKDSVKATEWYRKSAEQGDDRGQEILGRAYEEGDGAPKNYTKAMEWFQKAAAQGNSDAQNRLGIMYVKGEGVPKDYAKAMEWFQKAAAQGNSYAQGNLGNMYLNGEGVPKDSVKAKEWYQKAAAQGNADAKQALENMNRVSSRSSSSQNTERNEPASNNYVCDGIKNGSLYRRSSPYMQQTLLGNNGCR